MKFIYEEDVAFSEVGQCSNEIAWLLERRAGSCADVDAQLSRNKLGQRCLAEAWRAEEERVVEGFSPLHRGVDVNAQRFLHSVLSDEFGQALRAEGELDYTLLRHDFRSCYFSARH